MTSPGPGQAPLPDPDDDWWLDAEFVVAPGAAEVLRARRPRLVLTGFRIEPSRAAAGEPGDDPPPP